MAKSYRLGGGTRFFNRLLAGLIRLGMRMGSTCVLTTKGRTSGQPRSTPVTLVVENGHRWLVSPYGQVGWAKNVRAAGRAQLTARGRTEEVRLRELAAVEAAPILKKYLEKNSRIVGPYFDAKPADPVERFAAEAGNHPVFDIDPS